jgi:calcineurin-like phosphoesterase family protein
MTNGVFKYEDSALILIDYQKEMFETVRSETPAELIDLNVRLLIKGVRHANHPVDRRRRDGRQSSNASVDPRRIAGD